ncbi:MAG: LuxR C-terminal-related transcriptional regulator [Actinomycetota bacterium]|nr:LuxR C-terminal-related transcriptional regulator [Actinomycetota bacterium]
MAVPPDGPAGDRFRSTSRRARQLVELTCAAVPFRAWLVGYRDAELGTMQPLVSEGYRPELVDFLLGDFAREPALLHVARRPQVSLFWEDVAGFDSGPVARDVLRPSGFVEGTSLALMNGAGHSVGIVHLSLATTVVPAHARTLLQQLRPALGALADAASTASAARLTAREVEVLGLVARGRTNPQICAELMLSRSTVATHLEHILSKLGAPTRVDAAVTGIRLGLVDAAESDAPAALTR